jgi:hypothetical protein
LKAELGGELASLSPGELVGDREFPTRVGDRSRKTGELLPMVVDDCDFEGVMGAPNTDAEGEPRWEWTNSPCPSHWW